MYTTRCKKLSARNYILDNVCKKVGKVQETIFRTTHTKSYMAEVPSGTRLDKWVAFVGRWESIYLKHFTTTVTQRIFDNIQESFINFIGMFLVVEKSNFSETSHHQKMSKG